MVTERVPQIRLRLAATLALVAIAAGLHAQTDIRVDYDKAFSFAGLRTWSWHPDGKGDVRLALSADDDPRKVAARVDPIIIPAVEREMKSRGFTINASGADLHVHYYVLATVGQSAQIAGQFLPAVTAWGLPPFAAMTTALSVYPVGTLILDISSAKAQAIVWRGSAERKINLEKPDSERRKILDKAVTDLLKQFPPKPKK